MRRVINHGRKYAIYYPQKLITSVQIGGNQLDHNCLTPENIPHFLHRTPRLITPNISNPVNT